MFGAVGMNGAPTLAEALKSSRDRLAAAGVVSPRLDAEVLLMDATGLSRAKLYSDPSLELAERSLERLGDRVRRRSAREPVAYVVGRAHFRRLCLEVDRRVLVPRPETEMLVPLAPESGRVLDVGTGSGAVALAVKDEFPALDVTATDICDRALDVARRNAARLRLAVRFECADLVAGTGYDAILSNPPYVASDDWETLQPEIRLHEPRRALVSGPDGLDAIRRLVPAAFAALAAGGRLAVEVGAGQAARVAEMARRAGFREIETLKDLAGIERVVTGRCPEAAHGRLRRRKGGCPGPAAES